MTTENGFGKRGKMLLDNVESYEKDNIQIQKYDIRKTDVTEAVTFKEIFQKNPYEAYLNREQKRKVGVESQSKCKTIDITDKKINFEYIFKTTPYEYYIGKKFLLQLGLEFK